MSNSNNVNKRILVVVDYQNDFVKGSLGFPGAELLDAKIVNKIREYQTNGDIVLFTMDTHYSNYLETREGKQLPISHCIFGTEGWELYGDTGRLFGENAHYLKKETFALSPWELTGLSQPSTNIEGGYEDMDTPKSVEFVGLVTNMCVISNVVMFQGRFPEAQMIVDPNLCDSFDKTLHKAAIDVMRGMQVKILE